MEYPFSAGDMRAPESWPMQAMALLRTARDLEDGLAGSHDAWRDVARFSVLRRGARNTVLRAWIVTSDGAGRTLVLKLAGGDAALADTDLRCMQALSGTGVVPDVVAELADARGYAMEDGGDDTFTRTLEQGTAGDVLQAVQQMARAYARLHVEGRALVERTEALRSSSLTRELGDWTDALGGALEWLQLTADDSRMRRAMARVSLSWYAARDAVTLTHGDPAPSNLLLLPDGEARLVDFEYAAARHPFYDLAAWDVICPLPNDCVQALRASYAASRATLGWPVTDDDGYPAVLAHRALAMLSWLPPAARDQDVPWVDAWTVRQAVVSTLDRLAARTRGDSELQRLAEAAERAASHWRRQWPEVGEVLPPWPALRGAIA